MKNEEIKIKPDPENPRSIEPNALDLLKESMEKYGDLAGLVCNEKTGQWVCGHQRNSALKKLYPKHKIIKKKEVIVNGEKEWEGEFVTEKGEGTGFKVRIVNKSIEWQKMANLIANDQRIQGTYHYDKLRNIIDKYPPPPELDNFNLPALPALALHDDHNPATNKRDFNKLDEKWTHSIVIRTTEEEYPNIKDKIKAIESLGFDIEVQY